MVIIIVLDYNQMDNKLPKTAVQRGYYYLDLINGWKGDIKWLVLFDSRLGSRIHNSAWVSSRGYLVSVSLHVLAFFGITMQQCDQTHKWLTLKLCGFVVADPIRKEEIPTTGFVQHHKTNHFYMVYWSYDKNVSSFELFYDSFFQKLWNKVGYFCQNGKDNRRMITVHYPYQFINF